MIEENDFISYKGVISDRQSISILSKYFMQIFPTKYFTEGVPGSIIDSYLSGLPIVASRWESSQDIIIDGVTGILYDFGKVDDLVDKLLYCMENFEIINEMRENCIQQSEYYKRDIVISKLIEDINHE
jgi:glycosyltransferase involved in cell wall biosynthesis